VSILAFPSLSATRRAAGVALTGLQLVEIIRPLLDHLPLFGPMCRSVVSASVRISYNMGHLVLDKMSRESKHFI
jgi:hypothetical protein